MECKGGSDLLNDYLPTILSVALGLSGPSSLRLNKTGEIRKISPILTLILVLTSSFSTLAYLFYFSWSLMGWKQVVLYVAVASTIGSFFARVDDKIVVWLTFALSTFVATAITILLLRGI
jgi:hypothetical protein